MGTGAHHRFARHHSWSRAPTNRRNICPSGRELTLEQGRAAAASVALAVLGDLKRAIGDLDRVVAWVRVQGLVNAASGFTALPQVIDGFTDMMIQLFGHEAAVCPRTVLGAAELALNAPVIVEGEVEIRQP